MPGVTSTTKSRTAARRLGRIAPLAVAVAFVTVGLLAGSSARATAGGDDVRTALDRAHHLALTDAAATTPQTRDRRDAPVAALPSLAAAALVTFAGTVVARSRRVPSPKPRVAFRRRAPPLLRTAS